MRYDHHELMDMEQKITRLKLKARGAASINDYATANAAETEMAELQQQMHQMKMGEDVQPRDFTKLKSLMSEFLTEESKEPEHKNSDCSCAKDCAGTLDCDCGCQDTKDAGFEDAEPARVGKNIHIHIHE